MYNFKYIFEGIEKKIHRYNEKNGCSFGLFFASYYMFKPEYQSPQRAQ